VAICHQQGDSQKAIACTKSRHTTYRAIRLVQPFFALHTIRLMPYTMFCEEADRGINSAERTAKSESK